MPQLFISSTFSDMNDERDLIRNKIIPSINKKVVKKYGLFDAVDLRWGINTTNLNEKDSNKKVVEICLDRIYQCIPFFIVLIGDRYGYSIDESEYKKSIDLENYRKHLNPAFDVSGKRSITELEIEYGRFLSKYKNGYCFFYVRNIVNKNETPSTYFASSESDKEKIKTLREKATNEYNAKTYDAVYKDGKIVADNLQDLIIEDLLGAIDKELSKNISTQLFGIHTLEKEASNCFGREKEISMINDFLKSPNKDKLLVTGPSGVGKSATIARALVDSMDRYNVLPFYVKLSQRNDLQQYIKEINDYLYPIYAELDPPLIVNRGIKKYHILSKEDIYKCAKQRCGQSEETQIEISVFNLLISAISRFSTKNTILYLDGIDELDANQLINSFSFITLLKGNEEGEYAFSRNTTNGDFLGEKLKIIISSSNLLDYDKSKLEILNISLLEIKDINKEDLHNVVSSLFTKSYKKEKPFEQLLSTIIEKCQGKNCLYLNVVMHHLLYLCGDDFAQIASHESNDKEFRNNFLVQTIRGINENCEKAIAELLIDVCKKSNVPIDIFAMIAICKDGLTKKELYELNIGFNDLDYQYVDFILDSFFIMDERFRIKYAHQQIRKAVINNIVTRKHRKAMAHFLEKNMARHFYSYIENELFLVNSCNRFINKLIKENAIISYEALFEVIRNNNLLTKEIVSTSIVEKILQNNPFTSENDLLSLLEHKKYQTIKVALAYLRLYYIRTVKVRLLIDDIIRNTKKSSLRTLAIFYSSPIVLSRKIDFSNEVTHSQLIRVMVEIRRLYEKFENTELRGTKEIYALANEIAKIKGANANDLLLVKQEFDILFYSAINAFEQDFADISGLQNRLLKEVIGSIGNRIIIENYVFTLLNLNHYLSKLKNNGSDSNFYYFMTYGNVIVKNSTIRYLCDCSKLFVFYRDKVWNPVRLGKSAEKTIVSITPLLNDIEDPTLKISAIINLVPYLINDDELQQQGKMLIGNMTPFQIICYEIKCLSSSFPKCLIERIEKRLKQNSPYLPGSDFSVYKNYYNHSRKDKPLKHKEHLYFLSTLLRLKIRASRNLDVYANNEELLDIFDGIKIVSKTKNSLFKIAMEDPFIRLYGSKNYSINNLVKENPKNVDDLARVARVIQYWAEDLEAYGVSKVVYGLYFAAISKFLKCAKLNPYEMAYSSYALSCARKAARLRSGISYTERLRLFKISLDLVIERLPIQDVELLDEYEITLDNAVLTCKLLNSFVIESILSPNYGFLELVNLSRSVLMTEPNYTLSALYNIQDVFENNMYAYEFLRIIVETSDKSFIREMKSFIRQYSKKNFKPIKRDLFIETNKDNYRQRKLYCDMAIEMINNVNNNASLLKDRKTLLDESISSLVLTYEKADRKNG